MWTMIRLYAEKKKSNSMYSFNQVFRRVINMINVGGRAVGRAGVNNSFPKHNTTTVGNILVILGMIIEQVSAECRVQE